MPENNLDIVQIIEKNPISRLSSNYQNKLLNKIKDKFLNKEQQLFVGSFYCYLNYNSKDDFVINLNDIWKWIGFSRKDPAKVVLKKNFIEDIDYKILLQKTLEQDKNEHGGHNKEQILLNVNTFKKFCLKAGTKKADEIHDYYIKLEEILHETINEETDELRNQILLKDKEIIDINQNIKQQEKINKHKLLLEKFKNKRCVYIGEIEENKFIKIGSTKDIIDRYNTLNKTFKTTLYFLDIYDCQDFRDVESGILKDELIRKNLYTERINGHLSQEVVLLNDKFNYAQLINVVQKYVNKIYFMTPDQILEKEKIDLEREKLELEKLKINNNLLMNIINNDKYTKDVNNILLEHLPKILNNIDNNKQIIIQNTKDEIINKNNGENKNKEETTNPNYNILYHFNIKGRKPKGRKIQKIDPNNLKNVIKVYDSMVYALRCPDNKGCQKTGIQFAIKNNSIYKGYRWDFVEEGDDPKISKVPKTNTDIKKPSIINTIIELNSTKTEILDTYNTKDKILKKYKISKKTLIDIIEDNKLFDDKYFIEYHKCPQDLIDKYDKPINRLLHKNAKQIKQIHPITKDIVIFNTFTEIQNKFGICPKTIKNAIDEKIVHYGYLWEYV
jgi:hypothetical protein